MGHLPVPTDQLEAWIEGRLPEEESSRIKQRVSTDPQLDGHLQDVADAVRLVRSLSGEKAPPELLAHVKTRVRARRFRQRLRDLLNAPRLHQSSLETAAMVGMLLMAFALLVSSL
ncbi:MAG: hypothetical protein GMKNLPBB_00554 [Myxococcota bacterium]|nr:hypothetical protein [Myxococcota bacterium]